MSISRSELAAAYPGRTEFTRHDIAEFLRRKNRSLPCTKLIGQILEDDRFVTNRFYQPGTPIDPSFVPAKTPSTTPQHAAEKSILTMPIGQLLMKKIA